MASQGQEQEQQTRKVRTSIGHGLTAVSSHTGRRGRGLRVHAKQADNLEKSHPETLPMEKGSLGSPHRYRPPDVETLGWASPYIDRDGVHARVDDMPRAQRPSRHHNFHALGKQLEQREHRGHSPGREEVARLFGPERRRSVLIDKFEALHNATGKQEDVSYGMKTDQCRNSTCDQLDCPPEVPMDRNASHTLQSSHMGVRRSKSLDRRLTESSNTPDLLNFKKGWLSKLFEGGVWKKRWFVLTDRSLRWYRDAVAEEVASLDGEVDLSACCDVIEFPVLRNYGFQIHTKHGSVTLCAMTSGIRRHWIQAILKNVHPVTAPDVTRKHSSMKLPAFKRSTFLEEKARVKGGKGIAPPCPSVPGSNTRNLETELQTLTNSRNGTEQCRSRIRNRRLEGRYKTFDWAEFQKELLPRESTGPPERGKDTMEQMRTPPIIVPNEKRASEERSDLDEDPPGGQRLSVPSQPGKEEDTTASQDKQLANKGTDFANQSPQELQEKQEKQVELLRLQEQNALLQVQLQEALEHERKPTDGYMLQSDRRSSPSAEVSVGPEQEAEVREQRGDTIQPRLTEVSAEALAWAQSELQQEQERSRECKRQWERAEQGLRAQLKDSEQRLCTLEAQFLDRSKALRDLEQQQALQRDHLKEAQRLQESLTEVTGQLVATEEAQAVREQRLQEDLEVLRESQERERHGLAQCLATAQGNMQQLERRLHEAEQQAEALLRDTQPAGLAAGEPVHVLEAQLLLTEDTIENLTETVRFLREERSQLERHCHELTQQAAEAQAKMKPVKEVGPCTKDLQCSQQLFQALQQKNKEIRRVKERYEKLVERKDQELNEALVKMTALGSSLEETELRLQAKEQLLGQLSHEGEESELQAKLTLAVEKVAKLERCHEALQLAYTDLHKMHVELQEDYNTLTLQIQSFAMSQTLTMVRTASCTGEPPEDLGSVFCGPPVVSASSSEVRHCRSLSLDSAPPDTCETSEGNDPARFISIIHSLEAKLLATEKKLRDITAKLGEQWHSRAEQHCCVCSSSMETGTASGKLDDKQKRDLKTWSSSSTVVDLLSSSSGTQMAQSRKESGGPLSHDGLSSNTELPLLAEVERELSCAADNIRQSGSFGEDNMTEFEDIQNAEVRNSKMLQEDGAKRFAKTLAFEALLLSKIAFSVRNQNEELFLNLSDICQEGEELKRTDEGLGEIDVHTLALKLRVESEFWIEVEKLKICRRQGEDRCRGDAELADYVKGELAYAVQNLKLLYEAKFQRLQEDMVKAQENSQSRWSTLRRNRQMTKGPSVDLIPKDVQKEPDHSPPQVQADSRSPAKLRVDSPTDLAKGAISKHLSPEVPSYRTTAHSLQLSRDSLAAELETQAAFLQRLSREVATSLERNSSSLHRWLVAVYRTNPYYNKGSDTWGRSQCLQEAMVQAQVAYVVCRLRAEYKLIQHPHGDAPKKEWIPSVPDSLQVENELLRKKLLQLQHRVAQLEETEATLRQAEQRRAATELLFIEEVAESKRKLELVLLEVEKMEDRHEQQVQKLEETFQRRVLELASTQERETSQLHGLDMLPQHPTPLQHTEKDVSFHMAPLRKRLQELEAQVKVMKQKLGKNLVEKSIFHLKEEYQQDLDYLKATCERGFATMEEAHQRAMEDLRQQHQREVAKLQEEREKLLAEETAATIAAIEAMKKAHREELEKIQRVKLSERCDTGELGSHYEEELQSIHRELGVLSEQYSHKCLENTHLGQALEAERLALRRCQRENRELNARNQELNKQLREEISRLRRSMSAEAGGGLETQSTEQYELEVLLRVKESEIQCLKQELDSLREELQAVLRQEKEHAANKHKRELSVSRLKEQLVAVTEAHGTPLALEHAMRCESGRDLQKKERLPLVRRGRGVRSKSLNEGLTVEECRRLFEGTESRKV